jgi:hypothetical protein
MTVEEFTGLFFNRWYCENGCPMEIVTDHDKRFMSKFWKTVMKLMGIKHKLLTAYHPQTDGSSKRLNKMVIQMLCFRIKCNQQEWVKALLKVCFHMMNTINISMGVSPFILKTGCSPHLLPPLISPLTDGDIDVGNEDVACALATEFIENMDCITLAAKDNLMATKVTQAHFANKGRKEDPHYNVGDKVLLAMAHRCREYMQAKDGRVAKFMLRYNGPYEIIKVFPNDSTYCLQLPASLKVHPNFHVSQLHPFVTNNDNEYPG